MKLSLTRLAALQAVAETGSYAAAARHLGVTPPNVSAHVRGLEADASLQLFRRDAGKLVATDLCLTLCDAVARMMEAGRDAERLLQSRSSLKEGRIVVGLGNAMPGMSLVAAFHRAYPGVSLSVETGSHQKILRAVLTHDCDVAVLPEVPEDARFRRAVVSQARVVAIAPIGHPLAEAGTIDVARLSRERLIFRAFGSSTQRAVDRLFSRAGVDPKPFLTLDARDGLYEAVACGLGIGFLWQGSTSRTDQIAQLSIVEALEHPSQECVFSLVETRGRIIDAFYQVADAARA